MSVLLRTNYFYLQPPTGSACTFLRNCYRHISLENSKILLLNRTINSEKYIFMDTERGFWLCA